MSSGRNIRDRIVGSTSTLVAAIAISALCWCLTGFSEPSNWAGFGAAITAMASLRCMVNGNALMRVRTWMVPSVFIVLCGMSWETHRLNAPMIGAACYALSQYFLFKSYQDYHAERRVVIAFTLLSAGSLFFPPLIYLGVAYYAALLIQLRAMTLRTLLAGLFGLMIPLEFYAGAAFLSGHGELLYAYTDALTGFEALSLPQWSLTQWISAGLMTVLFVWTGLHFFFTSFNDKIRVRMCFYVIIVQCTLLYAALALQPRLFNSLLPFMVLESSPLIGHYLAFAKGRMSAAGFTLIFIMVLAVITFNTLWNNSLLSF